jgi:hypothetical protein
MKDPVMIDPVPPQGSGAPLAGIEEKGTFPRFQNETGMRPAGHGHSGGRS